MWYEYILTIDQILKNPLVQKRIEFFKNHNTLDDNDDPQLLQTIKVPKNMLFLTEKLPKPNYEKIPHKKNLSFSNNEADIIKKKKQIKKNIEKELKAENMDGSYLKDIKDTAVSNPPLHKKEVSKDMSNIDLSRKKKTDNINNKSIVEEPPMYSERKLPSIENKYILPPLNSNEGRNYSNKLASDASL
jgi:hypothetical protein